MFTFNPPTVTEIAPDVFRFCLYAREINLQFNFFLIRDDEPLLFTTGFRSSFPMLREAVVRVIDPSRIRWIGFSHFESDECGALNYWLDAAPHAEPVCSLVSAMVNMNDFAARPAKGMQDGEVLHGQVPDQILFDGSATARVGCFSCNRKMDRIAGNGRKRVESMDRVFPQKRMGSLFENGF